ncbi:MAG: glycosyltransferase family 4 protein [Cellvibrionaceae bacterium]
MNDGSGTTDSTKGKLLYISKRADAASTRYRIFQFFPALESKGWKCEYISANNQSLWERLTFAFSCRRYSIVIIQRKLFDPLTLKLISLFNSNIVFDYDDAIFLNDNGSSSSRRSKRFSKTTHLAKLSLAGNAYLASYSRSKKVDILPTSIPYERYSRKIQCRENYVKQNFNSLNDRLVLVWIGSHSTQKYLESHRDIIEGIGEKFENLTLKIIGDFSITFKHINTQCIAWSAETEINELMTADIGIAPMDEDPWTKGKCALKIIQYMACGLPVISSDTGANAEIVVHNETGFLANDLTEWIGSIEKLQDAKLRLKLGENALERVKEKYTVDIQAERMDDLFLSLLSDSHRSSL